MSFIKAIFMMAMPMLVPIQIARSLLRVALIQSRAGDIDRQLFEPGWATDMKGKLL